MADDLRARIVEALSNTPTAVVSMRGRDLPFSRHEGHNYDATCALCRGEVETLADAVMALIEPEPRIAATPVSVPTPPGAELLRTLKAIGMSQVRAAKAIGVSTKHLNQICSGKAALSYEVAARLEDVTGVPASWWNAAEAAYRTALLRGVMATWQGPKVTP